MRDTFGISLFLTLWIIAMNHVESMKCNKKKTASLVTCRRVGEIFGDFGDKCRYWRCFRNDPADLRSPRMSIIPRYLTCPPGYRVALPIKKNRRDPCTVRDPDCLGEFKQTTVEDTEENRRNLSLRFKVGRDEMTLNLEPNPNVQIQAPLIVGRNGTIKTRKQTQAQQHEFYIDVENQASFAVWKDRTGRRKYQGSFKMNGRQYNMEPRVEHLASLRQSPCDEDAPALEPGQSEEDTYYITRETYRRDDVVSDAVMRDHVRRQRQNDTQLASISIRAFRGSKEHYTLETLLFIDYAEFRKWWKMSNRRSAREQEDEVFDHMQIYFSHIINGVDLRYRSITEPDFSLGVKFVGIYIAMFPNDSPFSEGDSHDTYKGKGYVEADKTLNQLTRWVHANKKKLPPHDQAALFTGYLMWSGHNSIDGSRRRIIGLGDIGDVCGYWRCCINMEVGQFGSTQTLAHEMAHGLGAGHDGWKNNCDSKDQYIMASTPLDLTDDNYRNAYTFSRCSIQSFREYIHALNMKDNNCLKNNNASHAKPFEPEDNINRELPGQILDPDAQCRLIYGDESYFCAGAVYEKDICRQMPCYNPRYENCFLNADQRAATGTSCGNKKWCINSECVYESRAPSFKDYCMYGDFKFLFPDGRKCSHVVEDTPWRCYNEKDRNHCCDSCARIKRHNQPECTYGDKHEWCSGIAPKDCYQRHAECCDSCAKFYTGIKGCEYGDVASWCSTQYPGDCYVNANKSCCMTCRKVVNSLSPDCPYGDRAKWCATMSAEKCYNPNTRRTCCKSCQKHYTGLKTCEYGNRAQDCATWRCQHSRYHDECCYTCRNEAGLVPVPPTGGPGCSGADKAAWCSQQRDYICYGPELQTCCATCTARWRPVPGCEFGDRASWCRPASCTTQNGRQQCCRTCANYVPITRPVATRPPTRRPTPPPPRPPTTNPAPAACRRDEASWCPFIRSSDCYVVDHICCRTCQRFKRSHGPQSCRYGDRVSWCHQVTRARCYETDIFVYCCDMCTRNKGATPGCAFGDRRSDCHRLDCKKRDVKLDCCGTCGFNPFPDPTLPTSIAPPGCPAGDRDPGFCRTIKHGGSCYDSRTLYNCCQTCQRFFTGRPDCSYGDRYTWCPNNKAYCSTNARECCHSCR